MAPRANPPGGWEPPGGSAPAALPAVIGKLGRRYGSSLLPFTLTFTLMLLALAEGAAPCRVLYFSQNVGGPAHEAVALGRDILRKLGQEAGAFTLEECTDCRQWSDAALAPYAALVSYGYGTLPLTEANRRALVEFVRGGKGLVALHAAVQLTVQPPWPEFAEMIGGVFVGQAWNQTVRLTVEDRLHPATRHLGTSLTLQDEIYQFAPWDRAKTHVLLSVDPRSVDIFKPELRRKDGDFAAAWCHPYGKGRVLYTTLGHYPAAWRTPQFQTFLLGAIRWAAGELPASVPLGSDGRIVEF